MYLVSCGRTNCHLKVARGLEDDANPSEGVHYRTLKYLGYTRNKAR